MLVKGREKSLLRQHPWVFSGAIQKIKGKPGLGDTVDVFSHDGKWLAKGAYSPESQIRVRAWSFKQNEEIDQAFFDRRLQQAYNIKKDYLSKGKISGFRLIGGESDGMPGITLDVYDKVVVGQFLSAGGERHKAAIVSAIDKLFPGMPVFERSDVEVRKKEGLPLVTGWLTSPGNEEQVIEEYGVKIAVNIAQGHKTGFYLDQRENRLALADYVADKAVLNCFCYTGTFSLFALKGGAANVTNIDVSDTALALAKHNHELNELASDKVEFVRADVFKQLREYKEQGRQFDVIVLDPPKFVEHKGQLQSACRGYKDINMVALQCLKPGGTLLTFSCSGLMEANLFQKVVADAALDAGAELRFVRKLTQAEDHPIGAAFPEGFYLKGLVCKKV